MKKFSIAAFSALALLASSTPVYAAANYAAAKAACEFLASAPEQHKVVRGDTLWGIASRFLQNPWCWPKVWDSNRDQIRNPHWIYPGQTIYFDRTTGRLRINGERESGSAQPISTLQLSPNVVEQELETQPIPSIASNDIEPFLLRSLIVNDDELRDAPYIVASREGRVYLGKDDKAYVRGDLKGATVFHAFRRSNQVLRDPSDNRVLGYEATYLGTLQLERRAKSADEAHSFIVTNSKEEISIGDRLVPAPTQSLLSYVPHAPDPSLVARVVSVYGGVAQAGQNQIVVINKGKQNGLDPGSVLSLYRFGRVAVDLASPFPSTVKLPDEQYGVLFVFRTFEKASYGLIMEVQEPVQIGDVARSPE